MAGRWGVSKSEALRHAIRCASAFAHPGPGQGAQVGSNDEDGAKDLFFGRRLRAWLRGKTAVGASAIVWAEFLCGPIQANALELAMVVVEERVPAVEGGWQEPLRFFIRPLHP